jgi:hypothetical protein
MMCAMCEVSKAAHEKISPLPAREYGIEKEASTSLSIYKRFTTVILKMYHEDAHLIFFNDVDLSKVISHALWAGVPSFENFYRSP